MAVISKMYCVTSCCWTALSPFVLAAFSATLDATPVLRLVSAARRATALRALDEAGQRCLGDYLPRPHIRGREKDRIGITALKKPTDKKPTDETVPLSVGFGGRNIHR